MTLIGLSHYRQGEYQRAAQLGDTAVGLFATLTDPDSGLAHAYNLLGLIAMDQDRYQDAKRNYQLAGRHARASAEELLEATTIGNVALVHTYLGVFDSARTGYHRMRAISHRLGDSRREGIALSNLGMLESWSGNPDSAVSALEAALSLFREVGYGTGVQHVLGQLATAYRALGRWAEAVAHIDTALSLARQQGARQEMASDLEVMGYIYELAGDFTQALELYHDAERLNRELDRPVETGSNLLARARVYSRLGNVGTARREIERALETHAKADARNAVLGDLLVAAELADRDGDTFGAGQALERARTLAAELGHTRARIGLALTEARIWDRRARYDSVLTVLGRYQDDLERAGYDEEWEHRSLEARAHLRQGNPELARLAATRAVSAVERVRQSFQSSPTATDYAAQRAGAYATLAQSYLALGDPGRALAVADAARGRAVAEGLTHLADERSEIGRIPAVIGEAERTLQTLRRIQATLDLMDDSDTDSAAILSQVELRGRLSELRSRYDSLLSDIGDEDRAVAAMLGWRAADGEHLRSALRDDEVLVEFTITSDRLITFVVEPGGISHLDTEIRLSDLSNQVRLTRELMQDPGIDPGVLYPVLESLYATLLDPVLGQDRFRHLERIFIVPQGVLNYVPYAALRNAANGRYLVQERTPVVLPSAAALAAIRYLRPEFDPGGSTVSAYAPFPADLPASGPEVETVSRNWPEGRSFTGRRATEARVRDALGSAGLVHLATHGDLSILSPLNSSVRLSPGSSGDADDDGRLTIREVLGLEINSQLVFLSGCQTGLGRAGMTDFARGEDYATLATAFLAAGARNVVATLWRVEDRAASRLAESFYRRLADSEPAEALARAQREMMTQADYRSPYYWAGYQILGDG